MYQQRNNIVSWKRTLVVVSRQVLFLFLWPFPGQVSFESEEIEFVAGSWCVSAFPGKGVEKRNSILKS